MTPYRYTRHSRTPRILGLLACVYAGLVLLRLWLDAVWWLIAAGALVTLPALRDVIVNTRAGLSLEHGTMRWFSGPREGALELAEIDHMRLDTRWDFSVRATAYLTSGKTVRLPDEACPPHRDFEQALAASGVRVERHHFTIF